VFALELLDSVVLAAKDCEEFATVPPPPPDAPAAEFCAAALPPFSDLVTLVGDAVFPFGFG
jgi:hypothetical protein